MNIAFIIQDRIPTTDNIAAALRDLGHRVDELVYCADGSFDFRVHRDGAGIKLQIQGQRIRPETYDSALTWCWGTARAAAVLLACFEDAGVPVLAPTRLTRIWDSKISSARLFEAHGVAIPPTRLFDRGASFDAGRLEGLGGPPYVFKFDYGTRGQGVRICESIDELKHLTETAAARREGFVVQRCIRDDAGSIAAYRVMVIADRVVPKTLRRSPGGALGDFDSKQTGYIEMLDTPDDLAALALQATRVTELEVCGVDLLRDEHGSPMVLECNDGAGTHRFDERGVDVSRMCAEAFINLVSRIR